MFIIKIYLAKLTINLYKFKLLHKFSNPLIVKNEISIVENSVELRRKRILIFNIFI